MYKSTRRQEYFDDHGKWQLYNPTELGETDPEELFDEDFAEQYKERHEKIMNRIIRIHNALLTLDELWNFPLEKLFAPGNNQFWVVVQRNLSENVFVKLHSLVGDETKNALTIPRFRTMIMQGPWEDDSNRELLRRSLRESKFDAHTEHIKERVEEIRHNRLAHQIVEEDSGEYKEDVSPVSHDEVFKLFDDTCELLGALSFGKGYMILSGDLAPSRQGGERKETCLTQVLDAVLKDSWYANQPEERGKWWERDKERMSDEELETLNKLRKRIGLPEV